MATDISKTASPGDSAKADTRRTMIFVVAAAACLGITGLIEVSSRPAAIEEYGKVGEPFYPDFDDPTKASSLEVYVFDAESVQPRDFQVQRVESGRWVIPSRHNYPADAEDQLAKTAASIIGMERGAMVTRWEADHAQYGVVNPRQDTLSVGDVEGVGKRIILRGDDEAVLADYIVGDQVEGETNLYYVRHPDEEEVYLTKLEIDLSTKFTDWIETDLFDVNSWDMTELTVNDYEFDNTRGQLNKSEVSLFSRKTSSDPWNLDGLDEENEEVDKDAIRETIDAISDLAIVGVRPKQKGLTPELKLDRQSLRSQLDVERLQADLLNRGFLLTPGEGGDQENLRLIAREGELYAATNDGLVYRLYFGGAFAGSQEELEIGFETSAKDSDDSDDSASEESSDETASSEEEGADAEADEDSGASGKPGRYVFVRVDFDKKYLGDEPTKPVEPEKPAELVAADEKEGDDDAETETEESTEEEEATEGEDADEPDPLAEIRRVYDEAKQKYDDDLREYETKTKEIEGKVEEGEKKAEELNRRFAEWYYVIGGESFEKLRVSRSDLTKPKEQEESDESGAAGAALPSSALPAAVPPADPVESGSTEDASPESETSEGDTPDSSDE